MSNQRIVKTIKIDSENTLRMVYNPIHLGDEEIDLNRLLFIDYMNLPAEIATFSIVFNSVGQLLAELNRDVAKAELDLKIFKSREKKEFREEMASMKKKYTIDEVDDHVRTLPAYKVENLKHINSMHRRDMMDALYWSMKGKEDKLQKLNSSISAEQFKYDLLDSKLKSINYVDLSVIKPLM